MDPWKRLRREHPWLLHGGTASARHVVLVLHGGAVTGTRPTLPVDPAYARMLDLTIGLRRAQHDTAVYLLRHRVVGWNADTTEVPDPVADAREALDTIRQRHPDAPIALLGHSMGGRTAFATAASPGVVAVCALAPWLPDDEPLPPDPASRRYVIAHGTSDIVTSPLSSRRHARRLRAAGGSVAMFHQIHGLHGLSRAPWTWHRFVVATTLGLVGDRPLPAGVATALESPDGLVRDLRRFADP